MIITVLECNEGSIQDLAHNTWLAVKICSKESRGDEDAAGVLASHDSKIRWTNTKEPKYALVLVSDAMFGAGRPRSSSTDCASKGVCSVVVIGSSSFGTSMCCPVELDASGFTSTYDWCRESGGVKMLLLCRVGPKFAALLIVIIGLCT